MMGRSWTMNGLRMLAVTIAALTASCSEFHAKEGGETHFLMECIENACPSGLSCVCGVCTVECEGSSQCSALGDDATCVQAAVASLVCDGTPPASDICDVRCEDNADCSELGDDFECVAERCRTEEVAEQIAIGIVDAGADGAVDASIDECVGAECGGFADPLVLIVLDTSGSMERKIDCMCTTASCEECLPECSETGSDKNRWARALEALTGTFDDFSCEARARADDPDEYDSTFTLPYHQPKGTQRDDGVLNAYASRLRLGIATFDGVMSYAPEEQIAPDEFSFAMATDKAGLWSYPPVTAQSELETRDDGRAVGEYRYPGSPHPYLINTGIRNRNAESGALIVDMATSPRESTVSAIHRTLLATRPFGGTPIASALDDVRALFERDTWMAPERARPDHPRHVILITDGRPDNDFRDLSCDCNEPGNSCDGLLSPVEQASEMHCPYPTPAAAARALLGAVTSVHVIAFAAADDAFAIEQTDAIAFEGGTSAAVQAETTEELRTALSSIFEGILDGAGPNGGSCTVGDLIYEDGASWQDACGFCDCENGVNACTDIGCLDCIFDSDCNDGQVCRSGGLGCGSGACVSATAPTAGQCDAPTNVTSFCGCDGETHASPCEALTGVAHYGACEPASCMRGDEEIAHGATVMDPCNRCTCIDGELLCTDRACE